MARNDLLQNNQQSTALVIDGELAGAIVEGPSLLMSKVAAGSLSARYTVDAETNTITLAALWEVSDDNSTFRRCGGELNAAPTVLATGTGGADAAVTRQIDAPRAVYGHRYCRASVLVGVTTGTSSDSATVAYDYALDQGF